MSYRWINTFGDSGVRLVDVNGDHRSDILAAYTGTLGIYEDSFAVQLGKMIPWVGEVDDSYYPVPVGFVQQTTGFHMDEGTRFADVDGDGLTDMVNRNQLAPAVITACISMMQNRLITRRISI